MTISAACTVKDGAGAPVAMTGGVDVTPGNTITIALASTSGVDEWELTIFGIDDVSVAPTLTVNQTTKTATFTAPAGEGVAIGFQTKATSRNGRDPATGRSPYVVTDTFGVYTLNGAVSGARCGFAGETFEGSAVFGWTTKVNALMREVFGTGASPTLFTLDFTSSTLGTMANATFVSTFSLAFARASVATVQTSTTAVDSTPTSDQPRFGANGATGIRGLVVEEARTNDVWFAQDPSNAGAWAAGSNVTTTANDVTGPSGSSTACRHLVASNGFSRSQGVAETNGTKAVVSEWLRAKSGTSSYQVAATSGTPHYLASTADTTFRRVVMPVFTVGGSIVTMYPCDGVDNGVGACDVNTDLHQVEIGSFATEAIITAGAAATRAGERVYDSVGSRWVDSGRLSVEMVFAPKGTPTQYAADAYLWYVDANNNAWIESADQKVNVKVGGLTATSGSAIAWSAGNVVRIWVAAGGGTNCVVEYQTSSDGGTTYSAATTLINTALAGTLAPSTIDLFCSGTSGQLTGYVKSIVPYRSGQTPSWVV